MFMFRVIDNTIVARQLPRSGVLSDGRYVTNYHNLPEHVLAEEGWLPVEDPGVPAYDPTTHMVEQTYDIQEDRVVLGYILHEIPPEIPSEEELLNQARDEVARLSVRERVADSLLSNSVAEIVAPLFPELNLNGVDVETGDIFSWNGTLVEVIQTHTTQPNWAPENTPALYKVYRDASGEPQPWVQPQGAHDAYEAGAVVTHEGQTWINTHGDGNIWAPGVYGWVVQ